MACGINAVTGCGDGPIGFDIVGPALENQPGVKVALGTQSYGFRASALGVLDA